MICGFLGCEADMCASAPWDEEVALLHRCHLVIKDEVAARLELVNLQATGFLHTGTQGGGGGFVCCSAPEQV